MQSKSVTFFAELVPEEEYGKPREEYSYSRTHYFSSEHFRGPKLNEQVFFEIDLSKEVTPVLPGTYTLKIYSIYSYLYRFQSSNVLEYTIEIEKDDVIFTPYYDSDPGLSTRKDCTYTVPNPEVIGYDNYFKCYIENSLGKRIPGTVGLYITQREGFQPVFKKVKDYKADSNGLIDFMYTTRSYYREYSQSKMVYDGEQSLFYNSAYHIEDLDQAKDKFVNTAYGEDPSLSEYVTNGTDCYLYTQNTMKKTTRLLYESDFKSSELQWTKYSNADPATSPPRWTYYSYEPYYIHSTFDKDNCPDSGNFINTSILSPKSR
jgi:hypothetical protein